MSTETKKDNKFFNEELTLKKSKQIIRILSGSTYEEIKFIKKLVDDSLGDYFTLTLKPEFCSE